MKNKVGSVLLALGLALGLGLVATPAQAAVCHPAGSVYFCGEVRVHRASECALISYGGWSARIGGHGTRPAVVRAGQVSTRYHKDSDGVNLDPRCSWREKRDGESFYRLLGRIGGKDIKNRTGSDSIWVGYR